MQEHIRKTLKYYKITLASISPRRRELIKSIAGVEPEFSESGAEEKYDESEPVENIVTHLAEIKAQDVFKKKGGIVLGADTLVSINGRILGKPRNFAEAEQFFKMLCGKTHEVTTGICFMSEEKKIAEYEKTYVTFNAFDGEIVYTYINSGKPFDKAGGYGIQDDELKPLIKSVEGDITNVIGLPVALTEKTLKENF